MVNVDDTEGEVQYRFRCGALDVDPARAELRVHGELVALEPKPLGLLIALIEQPRTLLSRAALLERLWGHDHLSDNVLANAVMRLRRALGDELAALIRNVQGQGYLFDGQVERVACGRRFESRFELLAGAPVPLRPAYVLERSLGSSALSEVWLARHARTHDRRVFKFCSDGERLAALKREFTLYRVLREALGERDDYARVVDTNFADPPFFLECEYGGERLSDWAAEGDRLAGLPLAQRLALFVGIARSVADAHRVGVLHKDLKPHNVLVAPARPVAGGGEPVAWITRITDFGSGRLLSPDALERLGVTAMGLTLTSAHDGDSGSGTLIYMAPELFAGAAPTLQSDLYALGLMLWQLAVGDLRRPMATGWEADIADDLLREDIAAATQGRPEARLRSVDELVERLETLDARRTARRVEHASSARAAALATELARTRARRPWLATAIGALAIGLACSLVFWWRERAALHEALAQQQRAQALGDFLTLDVLNSADVTQLPKGGLLNLGDLLKRASARGGRRLQGQPLTEASVRETLGELFQASTEIEAAEGEYRRALALLASQPASDPRVLSLRLHLARVLAVQTHLPEARALLAEAEHAGGAALDGDTSELAYQAALTRFVVFNLGQRYPEAQAWGLRRMALLDRLHPDRPAERFAARRELAGVQLRLGDMVPARERLQQALAAFPAATIGEINHARGELQLAQLDLGTGQTTGTEAAILHARDTLRTLSGPQDAYVGIAQGLLGDLYLTGGRLEEARAALDTAYDITLKTRGPDSQLTVLAALNRAVATLYSGHPRVAREQLEALRARMSGIGGESGPTAQAIDFFRAVALADEGQGRPALEMLAGLDAARLAQAVPGTDWPWRLQAERGRASVIAGDRSRGLAALDEGLAGMAAHDAAPLFLEPLRRYRGTQPSASAAVAKR